MNAILLTGAALVGIPILLHLIMRQEPRRMEFPAYRFLVQKLRVNQRKLRLRHWLLLAMRMGLIALFCLTLYQPTLLSERFHLYGERPVAVVLIVDTRPSMGYQVEKASRFDEARRRALEFLDELPSRSAVALLTTDDPAGRWGDIAEARQQLERLELPPAGRGSLSAALAAAYQLLARIESPEGDDASSWSKLVVALTDRTVSCWEAERTADLQRLRDSLSPPVPAHTVFDVGVDAPVNVGITAVTMRPQVIAANQTARITVTVSAVGPAGSEPVAAAVTAELDGGAATLTQTATVPPGQSRSLLFEFANLTPGLHQVAFRLAAADRLPADNVRYWTFRVGAARQILTISDHPDDALFWQAAHAAKGEFRCLTVTPEQLRLTGDGRVEVSYADPEDARRSLTDDIRQFDVVCLLSVRDPSLNLGGGSLWDKLRPYVQSGGKLLVIPGPEVERRGYQAADDLMPGTIVKRIDTRQLEPPPPPQTAPGWSAPRDGANGVTWWLDDRVVQHPMLRDFQQWRQKGNVTEIVNPRRAWKYWEVQPASDATVIVRYYDATDERQRRPAVLERGVPDPRDNGKIKGRVVLLTTRLDVPTSEQPPWNDYWESEGSRWYVVFPYLLARYLAGDLGDANFNHLAGTIVTLPLPKGQLPRGSKAILEGPGVVGSDQIIDLGEQQTELRLGPPLLAAPGNYTVSLDAVRWREGFSLNVAAEDCQLERVPIAAIEEVAGPGSVVPLEKGRTLREMIETVLGGPIDLFPWLLIAVLLLLAAEGVLANRFYRLRPRPT